MKSSAMFVLMIVVVLAHMTAQNSICNTTNPFLALLDQSSSSFLSTPVNDSSKCSFEWGTYGTCCDHKVLKAWAENDLHKISKAIQTVVGFVSKYVEFFKELIQTSIQLDSSGLTFGNPNRQTFVQVIQEKSTNEAIEKISNFDKSNSLKSCWNHMATIRSNSICSLCSGRWNVFFTKTGEKKTFISQDLCDSVVNHCKSSFKGLVEFIELVDKINKPLLKAFSDPSLTAPEAVKFFRSTSNWVDEIRNKGIVELVDSNESTKKEKLCEVTVAMYEKTLIEKVANQIGDVSIDKLISFNKDIRAEIKDKTRGSRLRLLQADLHSNFGITDPLFVGDVKVVANIDSSYTSHLGAIGASANEHSAHFGGMPLNITSRFP